MEFGTRKSERKKYHIEKDKGSQISISIKVPQKKTVLAWFFGTTQYRSSGNSCAGYTEIVNNIGFRSAKFFPFLFGKLYCETGDEKLATTKWGRK